MARWAALPTYLSSIILAFNPIINAASETNSHLATAFISGQLPLTPAMPLNYAVPDLKHRYPAEERGMSFWQPPNTATLNTRTIITALEVSID